MRSRMSVVLLTLIIAVSAFNLTGCSLFQKPSDEEALKAVEGSGLLNSPSFTITSPLTIVARGERKKDGSWPIQVQMMMTMKMLDGKMSEPRENKAWFRIMKVKDSVGKSEWKAVLGQ